MLVSVQFTFSSAEEAGDLFGFLNGKYSKKVKIEEPTQETPVIIPTEKEIDEAVEKVMQTEPEEPKTELKPEKKPKQKKVEPIELELIIETNEEGEAVTRDTIKLKAQKLVKANKENSKQIIKILNEQFKVKTIPELKEDQLIAFDKALSKIK